MNGYLYFWFGSIIKEYFFHIIERIEIDLSVQMDKSLENFLEEDSVGNNGEF